jgi:DNA-binding NarL/FixJ family response regulator
MNILITEDDPFHRTYLKEAVMRALPECAEVFEADNGGSAVEIVAREEIHGVVMDLQMPQTNGVTAAKEIWRRNPAMGILFWSNYADEAYVRGVSRIVPQRAAYGYLLKSASEDRLVLTLRGVLREEQCIIDREIRGIQQRAENLLEGLTDSEFEVLMDIALGMTDKAIAARRSMSTRGVQSRLKHLYEKLGVDEREADARFGPVFNSRTRAVAVAMARGLLNADGFAALQDDLDRWLSVRS